MNVDTALVLVECSLIGAYDVTFLNVEFQNGFIYVFVASHEFKHYKLSERINSIFELLKFDCPDIISEYPILVEAFDEDELQEQIKHARQTSQRQK